MTQREIWAGDNMDMLASQGDESAAMIYMDPPFASNRGYDAILSSSRHGGSERVGAFDDRWAEPAVSTSLGSTSVSTSATRDFLITIEKLGLRDMANYLNMITPRLIEAHRVISKTGSLFVHCDPAASHYLKILLDVIFGADNFRNEIVWKRTHAHSSSKRFGPVHDIILFYSKSKQFQWNPMYTNYDASYLEKHFRQLDERGQYQLITCTAPGDRPGTRAHYEWKGKFPPPGRHWAWKIERMRELESQGLLAHSVNGVPRMKRYVDDGPGVALQDVWTDIRRLDAHSEERVGYDTQKPVALIERLIAATTTTGDLVIDPFGGSGTTAVAAERMGRSWISADLSLLAASFTLARTRQAVNRSPIRLVGFPTSVRQAEELQVSDPQTYGMWGTSMLATSTTRKSFSEQVASGSGRLKVDDRTIDFASWVPLSRSGIPDSSPLFNRKRLPTRGLLLRTDGSNSLRDWLSTAVPALPIIEIDVAALVSGESRQTGFSPEVPTILRKARS